MDQKIVTKHFQQTLHQATGKQDWQMQKTLKATAKEGDASAKKAMALLKKTSLTRQEARKLVGTLKETGILKNVGAEQILSREDRRIAAEEGVVKKERAKGTAAMWRTERAQKAAEEAKGKSGAKTSIAEINPAGHSALAGRENIAKGKAASVSISRATQPKETPEKEEEKPVAVDLMID